MYTFCHNCIFRNFVIITNVYFFPHKVKYPKTNGIVSTGKHTKPRTELPFPALTGRHFGDTLKTAYVRA